MPEVLLLACLGMGHYNPCLQLARAILSTRHDAHVTMVVPVHPAHKSLLTAGEDEIFEPLVEDWSLRITEHDRLHQWVYCPGTVDLKELLLWFYAAQQSWVSHVKRIYQNRNTRPDIIICDMMVVIDQELAHYWNIPTYSFTPSPLFLSAIMKDFYEYIQELLAKAQSEAASGKENEVPTAHPPSKIVKLPGFDDVVVDLATECLVQNKDFKIDTMKSLIEKFNEAFQRRDGCIANDIKEFYTSSAIKAVQDGRESFRVMTVGPLALNFDQRAESRDKDPVIEWLNERPANSVVFISMGSTFDIPHEDLMEFAAGLEMTGLPVVWAHRPVNRAQEDGCDLNGLPTDFEKRNRERILIVPWVNQLAVLKHPAVGLFVTHSGWNGLLEGISIGHTPLLMLPVGAEQPLNAKLMAEHYRIGQRLWNHPAIGEHLERNEVAEKIKRTMTDPELSQNQKRLRELACNAWDRQKGGSSYRSIQELFAN